MAQLKCALEQILVLASLFWNHQMTLADRGLTTSRLENGFKADMPAVHPRHAHLFKDYKIPRDENFNPVKQGGVGWIAEVISCYRNTWMRQLTK